LYNSLNYSTKGLVINKKHYTMAQIKISKTELLSDKKFPLKNYTYEKPDANGQIQEHKTEVYFRPDAAAVLLYDEQAEKFLLTRQFRLPSYLNQNTSGYLTEVCAGLIDDGETPEQTIIREAEEELGCKVVDPQYVGAYYTSAGGITEYLHLFMAPYNSKVERGKGGGLPEEGEDIEILEMDFAEVRDLLNNQKLNDAKTVMLLQHYFLFR
jgi:GDP-mannose pyrophosphatase NudK